MTLMEWLQALTAGGALGAVALAIAAYLKTRPAMKAALIQGEAALWLRIEKLEEESVRERERCDERITRIEERGLAALGDLRTELEGAVQLIRHDRNNLKQVLTYILVRIRKIDHPELAQLAEEAEAMLERGEQALALERGAMKGKRV